MMKTRTMIWPVGSSREREREREREGGRRQVESDRRRARAEQKQKEREREREKAVILTRPTGSSRGIEAISLAFACFHPMFDK
jgi:hypothetical protein